MSKGTLTVVLKPKQVCKRSWQGTGVQPSELFNKFPTIDFAGNCIEGNARSDRWDGPSHEPPLTEQRCDCITRKEETEHSRTLIRSKDGDAKCLVLLPSMDA